MSDVRYEKAGRVARITMDRPRYRNAQSRKLLEELDAALAEAMADHDVRVAVLFGEGEHWSSGHDIGTSEEIADRAARPYPEGAVGNHQRSWDWNVENTMRWRDLPKPTLAAVQGLCIYGGWMIAAAMDLIVAADDAQFIPFLFQYQSVPWDIGFRRAKDIMWEQGLLGATEAKELGFVSEVVPRVELDEAAMAKAERIARLKPIVAQMIKRQVNDAQDAQGFRSAIAAGHSAYMLSSMGGGVFDKDNPYGSVKRMPGIERARQAAATTTDGSDDGPADGAP
jgi:enoyl-CoA hydratase